MTAATSLAAFSARNQLIILSKHVAAAQQAPAAAAEAATVTRGEDAALACSLHVTRSTPSACSQLPCQQLALLHACNMLCDLLACFPATAFIYAAHGLLCLDALVTLAIEYKAERI
jgi:hypothetical protein